MMQWTIGLIVLKRYNLFRFNRKRIKSPFYSAFKSFEDFPLGNKSLFMSQFDLINIYGIRKDEAFQVGHDAEKDLRRNSMIGSITVGLSSGSSGNRGIFLVSEKERAQWVASILYRVIGLSLSQRTVAFFLRANSELYESVRSKLLKFTYYNIFDPLEQHWKNLLTTKPDIIVAQPSVLIRLIEISNIEALPWKVEKIISVAEVLTIEDSKRIEVWSGTTIDQVYQCTEGFLAHSCKNGKTHWNSDSILVEKVWLNKMQYKPTITDLKRSTQPIIRYEMNDILTQGKCDCGLKSDVIHSIDGRSDDVFEWMNNETKIVLFPDFIRRTIIFSHPGIVDYTIVKELVYLKLWIDGPDEAFDAAKNGLKKLLESKGINTKILKSASPWRADNGKKKRVINLAAESK